METIFSGFPVLLCFLTLWGPQLAQLPRSHSLQWLTGHPWVMIPSHQDCHHPGIARQYHLASLFSSCGWLHSISASSQLLSDLVYWSQCPPPALTRRHWCSWFRWRDGSGGLRWKGTAWKWFLFPSWVLYSCCRLALATWMSFLPVFHGLVNGIAFTQWPDWKPSYHPLFCLSSTAHSRLTSIWSVLPSCYPLSLSPLSPLTLPHFESHVADW